MDTWGFVILAVGAVFYWGGKKQRLGMFFMGAGVGIIFAAIGAYLIVMSRLP